MNKKTKKIALEEKYKLIEEFISNNINQLFHDKRKEALNKFKPQSLLNKLLKKNPYLFYSLNISTAEEFITRGLGDLTSSSDEAIFGSFLEDIAVEVVRVYRNGDKSSAGGLDAEFTDKKENKRYFISIKSGKNWGNSSSIAKQHQAFDRVTQIYKQNKASIIAPQPILGICYGKWDKEESAIRKNHIEYRGQRFWEFISNDNMFYTRMIEPLKPETIDTILDEYKKCHSKFINLMTKIFHDNFINEDGVIDWVSIIKFNSSPEEKKKLKT